MKKKITHYSIIAFAVAILGIAIGTIASNTTISFQIPHTIINTIGGSSGSHATVSYDKKGLPGLFVLSTGIKPVNATLNLSGIESLHCSGQLVGTYTNPNWFQNAVFPIDNDTLSDFTTKTDSFHGYGNLSMSGGLYTNCSGYNSDLVFGYINYKYSGYDNLKIWAGVKTGEDGKIANFLGKEDEGQLRVIQGEELTLQGIIYDSVSSKGLVTPGNGKYASGSLEFTGENVTFDTDAVAKTTSSGISVILGSNMQNYTWVLTGDIDIIYSGDFGLQPQGRWYYTSQNIYLSGDSGEKKIYYSLLSGDDIIRSEEYKIRLSGGEPGNNEGTGIDCSFDYNWNPSEIPQNGTSTINLICTGFKGIVTRHTLASRESGVKYSNPGLGTVSLESTETGGDTTIFTLKFAANEIIGTGRILITGDVIHDVSGNYNKPTERSPILTVTGSDTPGGGSQSDSGSVECAWGIWFTGIVSNGESATIALTCTGTSGNIVTQTITGSSVWSGDSSLGTISDGTRYSSSSHGQDSQRIANYTFTFTGGTGNGEVKLILREGTVCNNNGACNISTEESGPLDVKNGSGGGNDPESIEPPVCIPGNSGEVYEFSGSVDVTCTSDTGTKVIVSTGDEDPSCSSPSDNENIWTGTFTQDTELKVIACTTSEGSNGSGSTIVKYGYRRTDNQGGGGGGTNSGTSLPIIEITGPESDWAQNKNVSAIATNNPTTFQYAIVTGNTECSGNNDLGYLDYTGGSGLTFTAESDSGKYVCFKATNDSGTVYKKSNIIDKIDRTAPTFTFDNNSGYECAQGTLRIANANDTGAGLANNGAYKFGSGNWGTATNYTITAQQPGTKTVTGYVKDQAGNITEKTATYTFYDVVPTANRFSIGNIGNTAKTGNWKTLSNATEGNCGNGDLTASVATNGEKGNCSINGNMIIYTPYNDKTGSDNCTITIKDNENSTVDVTVTFNDIDTTDHGGNNTPGGLTSGLNIELRGIGNNSDEYTSDIELKIIWHGGADTRKILFTTNNTCPTSSDQYHTFGYYNIADNYNGNTSISSFTIPSEYEGNYVCVYGDNGSQYGIARTNYPIKFIHTNTGHTGFYYISPASGDIVRPGRITLRWHQSGSGNQYDYKWEIATRYNFVNSSIVRSGWESNTNTVSTTIDETGTYYRRVYEYIGDTGYVLSGVRFYIAETGDNGIYGCDSINNTGNLSGLTANQKLWGIVFVDSLVETYQDSPQKLDNFLRTFRHVLKDKYDRYCKLIYEADNNTERQEYKEAKDAVQFIYWVIGNRLDDLDLDSYEVYIAPNGKQYRVEYDRSRSAYTSPDFVYTKYFPTREIFTSHIDINNPAVGKWGLKGNVVTAYNGKQYTIYQTTDGRWTSDNFIYKKYFKNKDEIIDHILVNNTLSNWNHELDTSFDPITYTAPNGKPYEIFKTSKDGINGNMYSSYEFASAKYFPTLEAAKKHIDQNNPKK